MEDFYTIATNDGKFVYFDMGMIKYDKKLPRRSCMIGKDEGPKFIAKAEACIKDDIDRYKERIKEERKNKASPTYGWGDSDERYLSMLIEDLNKLTTDVSFNVVKVTFEVV